MSTFSTHSKCSPHLACMVSSFNLTVLANIQNPQSSESILLLSILQSLKNKSLISKFNNAFKVCHKLYFSGKVGDTIAQLAKGQNERNIWKHLFSQHIKGYFRLLSALRLSRCDGAVQRLGTTWHAVTPCIYKTALLFGNVSDRLLQKYSICLRIHI